MVPEKLRSFTEKLIDGPEREKKNATPSKRTNDVLLSEDDSLIFPAQSIGGTLVPGRLGMCLSFPACWCWIGFSRIYQTFSLFVSILIVHSNLGHYLSGKWV